MPRSWLELNPKVSPFRTQASARVQEQLRSAYEVKADALIVSRFRLLMTDSVEKLEIAGSESLANVAHWRFQPVQNRYGGQRQLLLQFIWDPHLAARETPSGPENFQQSAKGDFFNTIDPKRTSPKWSREEIRSMIA